MKLQGAEQTLHANQTQRLCIQAAEIPGEQIHVQPQLWMQFVNVRF